MKKNSLAVVSATLLFFSGVCAGGIFASNSENIVKIDAEESKIYKGLRYTSNGAEIFIVGFTKGDYNTESELIIPDTIDGIPVTKINSADKLPYSDYDVITLGRNIKEVSNGCFRTCDVLTVPDNYKGDLGKMFKENQDFSKVIIRDTCEYIPNDLIVWGGNGKFVIADYFEVSDDNKYYSSENGVLYNKDKTKLIRFPAHNEITKFVVPDSVEAITDNAFTYFGQGTSNTTNNFTYINGTIDWFDMGKNVRYYGRDSIYEITKRAKKITLPGSDVDEYDSRLVEESLIDVDRSDQKPLKLIVEVIEVPSTANTVHDMFLNCAPSLKWFTVEDGNKNYSSDKGVLYNGDKTVLIKAPQNCDFDSKTYTVSNKTTEIADKAFANTVNLNTITIPKSVSSISSTAFEGSKLTKIKGYAGSYAETFANEKGFVFVALKDNTGNDNPKAKECVYDVNQDGKVNVLDFIELKNYLVEQE
ncbi:MAG: leucine-rich repeat protein [Oscillospiraceae bacterium]|nr:leucine-rich repeat protein [Oscillospiraceae bacterium]